MSIFMYCPQNTLELPAKQYAIKRYNSTNPYEIRVRNFQLITNTDHELLTRWHSLRWRGHVEDATCCDGVDVAIESLRSTTRPAQRRG